MQVAGPKPKRSDYYVRGITGKIFRQQAYDDAVAEWRRRKDEERGQRPSTLQHLGTAIGIAHAVGTGGPVSPGTEIHRGHDYMHTQPREAAQARSSDMDAETRRSGRRRGQSGQR